MHLNPEEKELISSLRKRLTIRQVTAITGVSETTVIRYSKGAKVKMSKKHRNTYDIFYDMLLEVKKSKRGLRKSHIMQKANLSYDQLQKFLPKLEENMYLIGVEGFYQITRKGESWLRRFRSLMKDLRLKID